MSLLPRDDALCVAERESIDAICVAFENDWLAGRRPVIEVYLRQGSDVAQLALFRELLLLELDYRRSVRDNVALDDYLVRFERFTSIVRAVFATAGDRDVPMRFLPGSKIGRFRVLRTLGTGAFATVYLAWDGHLEREVAVKVPHASRLTDSRDRQRFVDESRAVARLRHPRIVTVYDAGTLDGETVFLVMQYIKGRSLREVMDDRELTMPMVCRIAADVADAIHTAHQAGVIHRDLKPRNILIDENDRPHVCDFGLALRERDQRQHEGEYAGTLAYMAPEQLRGEAHQLDGRADVWALGVILYELLTGRHPFQGRDRDELSNEILTRDPRPPRQFAPRVPRHLERVCLRCLAKRPPDRYPTASDVAQQLRLQDRRQRLAMPLWAFAVALLLVTAASTLGWFWGGNRSAPPPLPIRGTIRLTLWASDPATRQGVCLNDTGALPLRTGDRVRLAVELNQPAYAYVVWVDCQGRPAPVYPWRRGDWNDAIRHVRPQSDLALPEKDNAGWMMDNPQNGVETLLLLVRRTPLPPEVPLRDLLRRVPPTTVLVPARAIWFQDGHQLRVSPSTPPTSACDRPAVNDPAISDLKARDRNPVLERQVAIQDPMLKMHQQLARILRPHFQLVRAVTFPVQHD